MQTAEDRSGHRAIAVAPLLAGVPETMLWALHERAVEARRTGGLLVDPDCLRIHDALDYDYQGHFGEPAACLAGRAAEIDRVLRLWLAQHPDGTVISLGEGLETQGRRVDNGRMQWLTVDLPEAIRLRERFLKPGGRFRHIAASAQGLSWMDEVAPDAAVFIVGQGLLMYFAPEQVRCLFIAIADRFPGAELAFDTIPRWFSNLTRLGLYPAPHYRLPPMPWGVDRDEIAPLLHRWHPGVARIAFLDYPRSRGIPRLLADLTGQVPVLRHGVPSLVHATIGDRGPAAAGRA